MVGSLRVVLCQWLDSVVLVNPFWLKISCDKTWVLAPWHWPWVCKMQPRANTRLCSTHMCSWFASNQPSGSWVTYFHCIKSQVQRNKQKKKFKQSKTWGGDIHSDFPPPPWSLDLATIQILSQQISNLLKNFWQVAWWRFVSKTVGKILCHSLSFCISVFFFYFSCSQHLAVFLLLGSCSQCRGMEWLPWYMAAWSCIKSGC